MATITKEQIMKLEAQAPEGWHFDWKYYVIHGEKTLRRLIQQDETHVIEARIDYSENYETIRDIYRGTHTRAAGHSHISLHVSTWTVDLATNVGHSFGLGHFENLDNGQHTRKNYKDLCKIAATVTDETIKSYTADCKDRPLAIG